MEVTVVKHRNRYYSQFGQLPGRWFGPYSFGEMIRDLRVSALLSPLDARTLVCDAAVAEIVIAEVIDTGEENNQWDTAASAKKC